MKTLMDKYYSGGTVYEDFKKVIINTDNITKNFRTNIDSIHLLSICTLPEYKKEGYQAFYIFTKENVESILAGGKFKIGHVPVEKIGEELLNECRATTGLMAIIGDEKYIVSELAFNTLMMRAGVSGDMTVIRNNMIRDLHIADALQHRSDYTTIVYREVEGIKKIFAFMGRQYGYIPQSSITDMADNIISDGVLGEVECMGWTVSQDFTNLVLKFPEAAEEFKDVYGVDITPGVLFCTSDTGDSAVTARGIYLSGHSYVITEEIKKNHTTGLNINDLIKEVDEEIFKKIRKFPELLMSLIGEYVTDYSSIDLTTMSGQQKNSLIVGDMIEKIFKSFKMKDLAAKKKKEIINAMKQEINPAIPYTKYDLAMLFIDLPDRISGINDRYLLDDIRKNCGKVPQFIKDKLSTKIEDDSEIFLTM